MPGFAAADLDVLRNAHFYGLIAYSSQEVFGRALPGLAKDKGVKKLIVGVWDPKSREEVEAATVMDVNYPLNAAQSI